MISARLEEALRAVPDEGQQAWSNHYRQQQNGIRPATSYMRQDTNAAKAVAKAV